MWHAVTDISYIYSERQWKKGFCIKMNLCSTLPINKQVLLYSEAFCASIAIEAVVISPELRFGVVTVAFALWKLSQLVLGGAEWPCLLSDTRSVDHQAVLQGMKGKQNISIGCRV